MKTLLAIDTATERPSLALGAPGSEPAALELVLATRGELSREIERLASRLLRTGGLRPRDLEGVLLADGPGSFTGLRIGAAFAKGIVRSLGVPLLVTPSLLGAARAALPAPGEGTVVAEFDALRGDVFRAVYRFERGAVLVVSPPALTRADQPVEPTAARAGWRDASAAALLAAAQLEGGRMEVAEPADWQPDYGRPAEAEARRLAQGRNA